MLVSQERFLQLLSRKMAGEATIQELDELEELMHENDEQKRFAEQLMLDQPGITEQDEQEADAAFAAHSVKMQLAGRTPEKIPSVHGRRNLVRWAMRIAAILIIVAGGIYVFKSPGTSNEPATTMGGEITTAMGLRTRGVLPDGTTFWLNAGSRLTYAKTFGKDFREVSLTGEAFFDVVKKTNHPFIVHASGIDITVLGTAFNVKSYPDDKNVEITLYRGLVKVLRQEDPGNAIQLRPNEKLSLVKEEANETLKLPEDTTPLAKKISPTAIISQIDSTRTESEGIKTAWMHSRLEFRGDNFAELAKKLERWYNVTIVFTDEKVKKINFSGSFQRETIEQALAALQKAQPFHYKIKNHEIFIGSSQ